MSFTLNDTNTSPIAKDRLNLLNNISQFTTDFLTHWARKITDSLWVDFVIVTKDNPQLEEFFNDIQQTQDLLSWFKQNELECFLYGKSMPLWDIILTDKGRYPLFDRLLPSPSSNTIFLGNDQNTEYLAVGWRKLVAGPSNHSQLTLFQAFTENEMWSSPMGINTFGDYTYDGFVITGAPEYIKQLSKNTIKATTNYNALPVTSLFNRKQWQDSKILPALNTSNFNAYKSPLDSEAIALTDWYPIKQWLPLLDFVGEFLGYEMVVNSTKIIGKFDTNQLASGFAKNARDLYPNISSLNVLATGDAIVTTASQMNDTVAKQEPSAFKGVEWVQFFDNLINIMERICGFGASEEKAPSTYESSDKIRQRDDDKANFIRQRAKLRSKQYKVQVFDRLLSVFFNDPEIGDKYEFRVVSNILQEEVDNLERVQVLAGLGAIDNDTLMDTVHKEKSAYEIEKIKEKVKTENVTMEEDEKVKEEE